MFGEAVDRPQRLYLGRPSYRLDHMSPVPRSAPVSPVGSTELQYEDVLEITLDHDKIRTVCNQLSKDNQARDRAIGDMTGLVQRSLDRPVTQSHRPENTPPHPIIQPDLIANEGNLSAEDIGIT